jgi:hypothetical protein
MKQEISSAQIQLLATAVTNLAAQLNLIPAQIAEQAAFNDLLQK